MVRAGVASLPWHMTFVFFRLMVGLKASHALENWLRWLWSFSALWSTRAASSAKSKSRRITLRTLVFARRRAGLKSFPSERVRSQWTWIHVSGEQKRKYWRALGPIQSLVPPPPPPLFMSKASDMLPSYSTVPRDPSSNDLMNLRSFEGKPINCRILKRPSLLTKSKAWLDR